MLEQMFEMKTAVKLKLANNGFMLVRISFELSIKELIQCNCSVTLSPPSVWSFLQLFTQEHNKVCCLC